MRNPEKNERATAQTKTRAALPEAFPKAFPKALKISRRNAIAAVMAVAAGLWQGRKQKRRKEAPANKPPIWLGHM